MPREQKLYRIYRMDEYELSLATGKEIYAVSSTYAKDIRGAMRTFEQGQHTGCYMCMWDNNQRVVHL